MRKFRFLVLFSLLVGVIFCLSSCAMLQPKADLTPMESVRIAINAVIEETTDLVIQCKQYAAIDPAFDILFKKELLPIFKEISKNIDLALEMLSQGQVDKIDLNQTRLLLRQIALKFATAKGGE